MSKKKYKEFVGDVQNSPQYRESLEWSNFWYSSTKDIESKRFLIIGDSTARMVRSTLERVVRQPVDLLGTSSNLDDIMFVSQVDAFFDSTLYKYDAIFVQIGHHGRTSKDGGPYKSSDFKKYENDMLSLIKYLKQHCDKIILETVFDSVKPIRMNNLIHWMIKFNLLQKLYSWGFKKEVPDDEINSITSKKNEIIKNISARVGGVIMLDINNLIKNTNYIHIDHIHLEDRAKEYIAQCMIQVLN